MNLINLKTKKIEISVRQMLMLLITYVISTADVFLPSFVVQEAREDSWIAIIFGTIGALAVSNVSLTLAQWFPDKTIVQYAGDIAGRPVGFVIGILYSYLFIFVAWSVVRELEEIYVTAFNPEVPIQIFGIIVVIVAGYAVWHGLEVIARLNEILLPIGLFVFIFIVIINIPQMKLDNLLPIFYNGITPSLKGGLFVQTWLIEVMVILQLFPYVKEKEKLRKYINIAVIILGCSMMMGISIIAIFGVSLSSKFIFPALEFVRVASLGTFIQNLDIGIMIVWISGIFVKVTLAYFACVIALSQTIHSKKYKTLILPIGLIIIVLASNSAKSLIEIIYFLEYILPFYFLAMTLIIPVVLMIIAIIRKQKPTKY